MTLSQPAIDSARNAYDSAWLSTHGSHAKSIAAAVEAYLEASSPRDASSPPNAPTPPRAPAAETAEREAERRFPTYHPDDDIDLGPAIEMRAAFVAGASWQRERSALSESEREALIEKCAAAAETEINEAIGYWLNTMSGLPEGEDVGEWLAGTLLPNVGEAVRALRSPPTEKE
jgi:hypothetical protein